jgi:hypothetical protein
MAAWHVMPPSSVTMPAAWAIAGTMSGVVIVVTRISPGLSRSISCEVRRSRAVPPAMPGLAPKPRTSGSESALLGGALPNEAFEAAEVAGGFPASAAGIVVTGRVWTM